MSVLKKVYDAENRAEARLLRGLLESDGIPAVVRGAGPLSFLQVGPFRIASRPSVWVLEDDRLSRVLRIAHDYRTNPDRAASAGAAPQAKEGRAAPAEAWICPSCGERLDQFSDCWNCGDPRP